MSVTKKLSIVKNSAYKRLVALAWMIC